MHRSIAVLLLGLLVSVSWGQTQFQTLPQGFDNMLGGAATSWPVNTTNDQVWQWHYDSAEFDVQGPITITNLAIRASNLSGIASFSFHEWRVTLAEARTDFMSGDIELHDNILRSQVVRSGPWSGGPFLIFPGATLPGFISMGLTEAFTYDPSSGNDLIIQIEKCGPTDTWGTSLDAVSGNMATIRGVRRGHSSSCVEEDQNSGPLGSAGTVPVVRISYRAASQTLPQGFDQVDGNGVVTAPLTVSGPQKWQWHYDSDEFDVQAPIAIREIWVRSALASSGIGAFSFPTFEVTMASASTDYRLANRLPEFGQNVDDQKVVRTGAWVSGPVASGGSTGTWIPLGLTEAFVYDPSTGQDLIIQIETCGGASPFSGGIDGVLGVNMGGNRFGNLLSCDALAPGGGAILASVPIIRIDYESANSGHGAVTSYPWREDFDGYSNHGWENVERETRDDPADWMLRSGPTISGATGPAGDHTTGMGQYAYVEDSLSDNEEICYLSPALDLSGLTTPTLSFWMHSLAGNGNTNELRVDVLRLPSGPHVLNVVSAFGPQGLNWVEKTIDLSAFAGETIRIRFRVNNDNGDYQNDVAIDDIRVYEPSFSIGQAPQVSACLDVSGALTPTGVPVTLGQPGPYSRSLHFGESIDLRVTGGAFQPLALWSAPLNVGITSFPGIGQLDVGLPDISNFIWLFDGIADPSGPSTNALGVFSLSFPNNLPPGLTFPLQAGVLTGGPGIVALTNAVIFSTQ